jgi:hypothetical protein
MAGLKGSEMMNITLAFGEEQIGWQDVHSYEILEGVLTMLIYKYMSRDVVTVELPKRYRLIITKENEYTP